MARMSQTAKGFALPSNPLARLCPRVDAAIHYTGRAARTNLAGGLSASCNPSVKCHSRPRRAISIISTEIAAYTSLGVGHSMHIPSALCWNALATCGWKLAAFGRAAEKPGCLNLDGKGHAVAAPVLFCSGSAAHLGRTALQKGAPPSTARTNHERVAKLIPDARRQPAFCAAHAAGKHVDGAKVFVD